ncbi:hypothetical protein D3C71_1208310 [compost metagenome]
MGVSDWRVAAMAALVWRWRKRAAWRPSSWATCPAPPTFGSRSWKAWTRSRKEPSLPPLLRARITPRATVGASTWSLRTCPRPSACSRSWRMRWWGISAWRRCWVIASATCWSMCAAWRGRRMVRTSRATRALIIRITPRSRPSRCAIRTTPRRTAPARCWLGWQNRVSGRFSWNACTARYGRPCAGLV